MREFARLYSDFTDTSAFEHINPNIVKRLYIDSEENGTVWVHIYYWMESDYDAIPFADYKEAQRFIKRISGV